MNKNSKKSSGIVERVVRNFFARLGYRDLDIGELFRFVISGTFVAIAYIAGYYTLQKQFSLANVYASAVAFTFAVLLQYLLQTAFTYRQSLFQREQIFRFLVTTFIGLLFSTTVMGVLWPQTGLPEIISLLLIVFVLPIFNFLTFSMWVYARRNLDQKSLDEV